MDNADKIVKGLRKRKRKAVAALVLTIVYWGLFVFGLCSTLRLHENLQSSIMDSIRNTDVPLSVSLQPYTITGISFLYTMSVVFAMAGSFPFVSFLGECLGGNPRDRVTLALWDRVKELEARLAEHPNRSTHQTDTPAADGEVDE